MRIDLHCHTKATKTGDGSGRNATPELFAEKIELAQVKVVATTNHNHFDRNQYEALAEAVRDTAMVWPGVELDVTREGGSRWHMVVVCGPAQLDMFERAVADLVGDTLPDDCRWDFDEVWRKLSSLDALFISHCHDKGPNVTEADIEFMKERTDNDWRLYYEPRTLLTLGIWSNHGRNMMMGSDVKEWDNYEQNEFVSLRLPVDSFEQFFLLAKRDQRVVETLLGKCPKTQMEVSPHPSVTFALPVYNNINVIFGQKGTGKTEIMKSLRDWCGVRGLPCSCYFGGQKNQEYEKLFDTSDVARSVSDFDRTNGVAQIGVLESWAEAIPTPLEKYISWFETKGNNKKKSAFKISECQALPEEERGTYLVPKENLNTVDAFIDLYERREIGLSLPVEKRDQFEALLAELAEVLRNDAVDAYIKVEATIEANKALQEIKRLIDMKSDTLSKPDSCGFLSFVLKRMEAHRAANGIMDQLREGEKKTRAYLGELDGKGKLSIVTRKRFLQDGSVTGEFELGIRKLKKWKEAVEAVAFCSLDADMPAKVVEFVDTHREQGVKGADDFIGVAKYAVIEGSDEEYSPSDGEKGILMIEKSLRDAADVYLLDEPELGMSNLYIDSVIRPIVQDLAKCGRIVILSTHNANLAVRTLPYQSVYREHVGGDQYRTYLGNPFLDTLREREDLSEPIRWAETSMATLEGGPEAFYDRLSIYEAGNHA